MTIRPEFFGELTQDFTCTTRKCRRHPRADWTRASFHCTRRPIVEISAARADKSTRAAPSFNVPIDYQAISIPNTKSKDIKRRMCKF
ncbi:hypothetical protein GCWU000325_02454 [Alloprevotella tannerae ATCC 51259]|uniref:Uncharacterized protein n=1 Tax=Alloprevotella tannerae ATCC 51259 TaxID=626522 RepID=C9LJP1_9BACT|nr:hypothetical protein GCWU000325_02454 [Alloprevotella tannerae ATCC 51259]